MAIVDTDILQILSGGAANTNPANALGGAISTQPGGVVTTDTLHNVFDIVGGAESAAGDTEYRALFFKNTHATLTLQNAKIWISSNTPNPGDTVEIALADEGVASTIETIANESTAPSGPTFSAPNSFATGLAAGNIGPGQAVGIWIKRIVSAASAAWTGNAYALSIQGETAA